MQKHEINVAERIQFRAPVTADGHERERRKFLLRLRRKARFRHLPKMPQQRVQHRRARRANFLSARAPAMLDFYPVRFHLEKRLVTRELPRRVAGRRQRQALRRIVLNFSD